MTRGAFGSAALELHAHGLAVMPTGGEDGKTPLLLNWSKWRGQSRATVEAFARKHPGANVAIVTGLSRLTVVDADDENTLADAEQRFGKSPIVTRSPRGGGHLYFRSSGERNANLRPDGLNVDIKGVGGMVLAPPSVRSGLGAYRMERGSWKALSELLPLAQGSIPERDRAKPQLEAEAVHDTPCGTVEGLRNVELFTALRYHAEGCESLSELTMEAHAINAQFSPPMPRAEAEKTAGSVWRMKSEGRIILPGQQRIIMLPGEQDELGSDAYYFLAMVKRRHGAKGGRPFALSPKAMQKAEVLTRWGRKRYAMAIGALLHAGYLVREHKGGAKKGDPSLYRMGLRKRPNVTRHPAPPSPHASGSGKRA